MWRLVIGLPIVVLVLLVLFVMTPAIASCGEHGDLAAEAVLSCPRARELIGDDAHPARIGLACGTTEAEGNYGRASWSVPFTGERGRGTVSYDASEHAGEWTLDRATLEIGDETIDLVACTRPARPARPKNPLAQTNADATTATFDGKVIRSNHPSIAERATCHGELKRERGSASAHVKVTCERGGDAPGQTQVYDGSGGFSLDVRDSTKRDDDRGEYDDSKTSGVDGTPGCRLSSSGSSGTLTVWDTSPAFEIVVEL